MASGKGGRSEPGRKRPLPMTETDSLSPVWVTEGTESAVLQRPTPNPDTPAASRRPAAYVDPTAELVEAKARPAAARPATTPSAKRPAAKTGRRPASKAPSGLKKLFGPISLALGLLLLWPFIWSVGLLAGWWESERESARGMAVAMLVTGPVALALLATGIVFVLHTMRYKPVEKRKPATAAPAGAKPTRKPAAPVARKTKSR